MKIRRLCGDSPTIRQKIDSLGDDPARAILDRRLTLEVEGSALLATLSVDTSEAETLGDRFQALAEPLLGGIAP